MSNEICNEISAIVEVPDVPFTALPYFFIFIRTFSFYLILVSFVFLLDSRKVFEWFLSTYTCMHRCQANSAFQLQLSGRFFQQKHGNVIIGKLVRSTILPLPSLFEGSQV